MKLGPDLFPGFMGVWIALGGLGFYLFHVRKDAGFKRTWFPRFAIAAGVLFWAFLLLMGTPAGVLVIAAGVVALITFLNIRGTQFCPACGSTSYGGLGFSRPRFCPRCGAHLE